MRTKWLTLFIALFAVVGLSACGSNGSGGSDVADGGGDAGPNVEQVGVSNCDQCHKANVDEWLASDSHGNADDFPDFNYFGQDPDDCGQCHNPSSEGATLPIAFGEIGRPVIACEECHGGGSAHRGVGPIPFAWPDSEQCGTCHDSAHGDYALATAVANSAHNNSDDLHASRTRCSRCHTTEGSRLLSQYTGDAEVMHLMDDIEPLAPEEDLHPVTCATCHDSHTGELYADSVITLDFQKVGDMPVNQDWDPNGNGTPDQFDFCTQCHLYYNYDGALVGSGTVASGTAEFYHDDDWYRQITSTHYDDAATDDIIEGYNIRKGGESPCFDCHGHEFRTNTRRSREASDPSDPDLGPSIHTDWASSRHGGNLLLAKYEAADLADADDDITPEEVDNIRDAGREDGIGEGWSWVHYPWNDTLGVSPGARSGRGECQRCHTSTGVSNYMNNPANYNSAGLDNDFSHLEGWTANGYSNQKELLYCWGCHESIDGGEMLEPGGIVEQYGGDPDVEVTYPDLEHSNTCMACHIGREIGENIQASTDNFSSTGFINSHYLAAGASVLAVSGFEYAGMNYTNVSFYAHDSIGTKFEAVTHGSDLPLTDNDMGPCVGCHMTSEEGSHNYLPFEFNESGSFAYITPVCAECHTGDFTLTPEVIEEEELGYEATLEVLAAGLGKIDIFYSSSYPYFFKSPDDTSSANGVTNWVKETVYPGGLDLTQAGKNTMGAAFNFNLAAHDPGGFAHNRFYYKRLFWDAIDWVDDYVMNGSVPATINALQADESISAEVAAEASAYLGASRPGDGSGDRAPIIGLDPIKNF